MLLPSESLCKRIHQKRGSGPCKGPSLAGSTTVLLPLLPGAPLSLIQAAPVIGEHGVQELRVGVHRLLGELRVEFLGRYGPVGEGLVGLLDRLGELLSRLVYLLLLSLIH